MKILFLLIFATISASTDKFKHETIFESDEPNTKIDETTLKTANSDSTEDAINFKYTTLKNNKESTTDLFTNKAEIRNANLIETTTNNINSEVNFSTEKILDTNTKEIENGTVLSEINLQAEKTTEIDVSTTTDTYIPNIQTQRVTNKINITVAPEMINNSSTEIESTTNLNIPTTIEPTTITYNITTKENLDINEEKTEIFTVSEIKTDTTTETFVSSSNIESPNVINNNKTANKKHLKENDDITINKMNMTTENVTQNLKDNEVIGNVTEKSTKIQSTTKNYLTIPDLTTSTQNIQSVNVVSNNKTNEKYVKLSEENVTNSPEKFTESTTKEKTEIFTVSEIKIDTTTETFVSSSNFESPNVINNNNTANKEYLKENDDDITINKTNMTTENVTKNLKEVIGNVTEKIQSTTKNYLSITDSTTTTPNIQSVNVVSSKNKANEKYLKLSEENITNSEKSIESTTKSYLKNIQSTNESSDKKSDANANEKIVTNSFDLKSTNKIETSTPKYKIASTKSYGEEFSTTRDQSFYANHLLKDGNDSSESSVSEISLSSNEKPTEPSTLNEGDTTITSTSEMSSSSTSTGPSSSFGTTTEEIPEITDPPNEETTITSTDSTPEITTPTEPTTINPCTENWQIGEVNVLSSPFTINLSWNDPMPGCGFEYEIKWEPKVKSDYRNFYSAATTNQTEYTIYYLDACEDYKIYITTLHPTNNANMSKEIGARTTEYMLEVEKVISGNVKFNYDKNVTVSWTIPKTVQKCLKNYLIQSYKDDKLVQSFSTKDNSTTFYKINLCYNNTYLISSHSEHMDTAPKSITFLDPEINDPPVFIQNETEIYDDFVITKWNFGTFICRPKTFKINCATNNEKSKTISGEIHLLNNTLTAKIENVEPYSKYTCCGIIGNVKGDSKCSEPGEFMTKSKAPDKPMNIKISELEKHLEIEWDQPLKWNGVPEGYTITTEFVQFNYNLPKNCQFEKTFASTTEQVFENGYNFTYIIHGSKYKITVNAKSDGGWSESVTQEVDISEAVPEAPENLTAVPIQSTASKDYSAYFNLTWGTICKMYGQLEQYNLNVWQQKEDKPVHVEEMNIFPGENSFTSNPYLKPEYKYIVQLKARNREFDGKLAGTTFIAPAGIPIEPNTDHLKRPNASGVSEPWNSAVVYISKNIFDETYGEIKYVSIIVAEPGCEENPKNEYYNNEEWPKVASDNFSKCVNESRAYEATEPRWNPFLLPTKSSGEYEYILGANQSCNDILDCNRPLKSSTTYYIKLRVFTSGGYRDTKFLVLITEAFNDVPVGLIVGLIVGILAIAFIIAAVLFYTKGKLNFKNWPRMESSSQISPAPLPVSIKKFGLHYEKMNENPGKIKNEFQLLSTISSDVTLSTKTALLPHNKKKNRYINILPYDQTRVLLASTNENSSDYINASYIKGYSGSNEYIATQGPTEATCPAFWQMIIEQNVKLIVMLTQFVESGKDKCYKYFPDLKEEYDLPNDIQIQCTEEQIMNVYNKRIFKVKKGIITKKVTHMQFNLWPDFGVPEEVHYMLDFCETIKEIKLKKPSIIAMHCSAGVGRTGTLIAVDILLQNIRDKRKVDIFGTVLNLRKQRMNMVQSEKQYEFLYKCLYHVITNKISDSSSKHNLNQICESNML